MSNEIPKKRLWTQRKVRKYKLVNAVSKMCIISYALGLATGLVVMAILY